MSAGRSPLDGTDEAPLEPAGRDNATLGPSDSSDTGSDRMGLGEEDTGSDAAGTGERAGVDPGDVRATDIGVDHSFRPEPGVEDDALDEDEDPDLSFIDRVRSADDAGEPAADAPDADAPEPPAAPSAKTRGPGAPRSKTPAGAPPGSSGPRRPR